MVRDEPARRTGGESRRGGHRDDRAEADRAVLGRFSPAGRTAVNGLQIQDHQLYRTLPVAVLIQASQIHTGQ